ncbi:MAG: hypothetical protein EOP38_20445 [Rubrivivax sp.]|nr:MAG: hypothetical protein EOP38_20445 [Rubrivivax sp.]
MTWMLDMNGGNPCLAWMGEDHVNLDLMATALSRINRFNGRTLRPYSVAEHCVLVMEVMQRDLGMRSPTALLAGLLHRAHAAHTGDLDVAMSQLLGAVWATEEQRIRWCVLKHFGVSGAWSTYREQIEQADGMVTATARLQLQPDQFDPTYDQHKPITWLRLGDAGCWEPQDWQDVFTAQVHALALAIEAGQPPRVEAQEAPAA